MNKNVNEIIDGAFNVRDVFLQMENGRVGEDATVKELLDHIGLDSRQLLDFMDDIIDLIEDEYEDEYEDESTSNDGGIPIPIHRNN